MALHLCVSPNPNRCLFVTYKWSTNTQGVVIGDDRYVAKLWHERGSASQKRE